MTAKNLRLLSQVGCFALILAVSATIAIAQTETGQITGTVFDPSGATIMNATVTATDPSNKSVRTLMAPDGIYLFSNLLPGRYELTVAAPNFQTVKQTVTVTVGSKVGLDFRLPVGTVSEVVEVQERLSQVNIETQTVGANISGNEIVNLPTLTRNPYDLVKTVGNTTDSDPSGKDRGVGVSMNGLRASDVSILLDGVPNRNNFDTTVAIKTPLDSVGEITVLTNSFTAEYGRAVAGVINVDTKRGSNEIHGSVYEFNRVSALASNTFDNNANGISKSPFTRNQFGFSVGGPIKKDKLFVFANPEWIRVRSVATQEATIATPQLIAASALNTQSFFSTYGHSRPGLIPLQTFTTQDVCGVGNKNNCSAAVLAIPAGTPIYQKVDFNVPADSGGGDPQNTLELAGRMDYVLNDKTQLYFRYGRYNAVNFPGTLSNSPYAGYDNGETDLYTAYALSGTHIFSPNLISQTKLSFNRVGQLQPLSTAPLSPTLYTTKSATTSLGNAAIEYPGYAPNNPGTGFPFGGPQNFIQINQDITKIMGKHDFRFGGTYTYLQDNRTFAAYASPVAALGTTQASALNGLVAGTLNNFTGAVYPQGKLPCVNGPAGPIVTPACTLTLPVGPPNFSRSNAVHEAGLYVQDSWKIRPHLTLNLGVRWDYYGPQGSRNPNLDSNFYPGPGANIELQMATGKTYVSSDPKNPVGGLWQKDWHDYSPRLGFAWDVFGDGKTALRGGYGLGWIPNFGNVTFNVMFNPPNYALVNLVAGADVPTIPITNDVSGPLAGSGGTKPLPRLSFRWVDPYIKTAYAHTWSTTLEHEFGAGLLAALEYSGSKGVDLYTINSMNIPGSAVVYGAAGSGSGSPTDRANAQYGAMNLRTNGGFSNYNALNTRLDIRNFRRQGVTLRFNYTWSHAIDNISNTFSEAQTSSGPGNLGILDPLNPGLDKGSAEFDVRHRVSIAAIWQESYRSKNRIMDAILGGWSVAPNFIARTGTPFSVWDSTHEAYALAPRVMYDTPFHPVYTDKATSNPNQFIYMNLGTPDSSYVNPLVGVSDFGPYPSTMTSRDAFREPGTWNVDFAIYKDFRVSERLKIQLRGESYNLVNHSNLYIVYSNTDASATANITATRGLRNDNLAVSPTSENRNLQLAAKLIF